mgnify:CR=1 FL=1
MIRWLTILAAIWLAACGNPDAHDHPELKTGEDFYRHHCAACHRGLGKGDFLKGVPPAVYASLDAESFIARILGHQRPATTRMPIFATMPRAEAEAIAGYLRANLPHSPAPDAGF